MTRLLSNEVATALLAAACNNVSRKYGTGNGFCAFDTKVCDTGFVSPRLAYATNFEFATLTGISRDDLVDGQTHGISQTMRED